GITGFYLSSQATWTSASTQAMVQRDATTLLETVTRRAREAGGYLILPAPGSDSLNSEIIFYSTAALTEEIGRFTWDSTDSSIREGIGQPSVDKGAIVPSTVLRFHA